MVPKADVAARSRRLSREQGIHHKTLLRTGPLQDLHSMASASHFVASSTPVPPRRGMVRMSHAWSSMRAGRGRLVVFDHLVKHDDDFGPRQVKPTSRNAAPTTAVPGFLLEASSIQDAVDERARGDKREVLTDLEVGRTSGAGSDRKNDILLRCWRHRVSSNFEL